MALIITILSAAATAHGKSTFSNTKTTKVTKVKGGKAKGAKASLVNSAFQGVKPLLNAGEAVVSAQWEFTAGSKAGTAKRRALTIYTVPTDLESGYGRITATRAVRIKKTIRVVQTVYERTVSANGDIAVTLERFTPQGSRVLDFEIWADGTKVATLCGLNDCTVFTTTAATGFTATDDLWLVSETGPTNGLANSYVNTTELWELSAKTLSGAKLQMGDVTDPTTYKDDTCHVRLAKALERMVLTKAAGMFQSYESLAKAHPSLDSKSNAQMFKLGDPVFTGQNIRQDDYEILNVVSGIAPRERRNFQGVMNMITLQSGISAKLPGKFNVGDCGYTLPEYYIWHLESAVPTGVGATDFLAVLKDKIVDDYGVFNLKMQYEGFGTTVAGGTWAISMKAADVITVMDNDMETLVGTVTLYTRKL
jgi:hypothetical protein